MCWSCPQCPPRHHEDCCPRQGLPSLPLPRMVAAGSGQAAPPPPPVQPPSAAVHPMEPVLLAVAGFPCTLVAAHVRWGRRIEGERPGIWFAPAVPAVVLETGLRAPLPPHAHVTLAVFPDAWSDGRVLLAVAAVERWVRLWAHLPNSWLRTTLLWPLDRSLEDLVRTGATPLLCLRVNSAAHAACHMLADSALAAARALRHGAGVYPAFHVRFGLR